MMEFSGEDVIYLLKQKVADLSLEVEMYKQYTQRLEKQLDDNAVTIASEVEDAEGAAEADR